MISDKATNICVFFNNCHGGFALTNVLKTKQMIEAHSKNKNYDIDNNKYFVIIII